MTTSYQVLRLAKRDLSVSRTHIRSSTDAVELVEGFLDSGVGHVHMSGDPILGLGETLSFKHPRSVLCKSIAHQPLLLVLELIIHVGDIFGSRSGTTVEGPVVLVKGGLLAGVVAVKFICIGLEARVFSH